MLDLLSSGTVTANGKAAADKANLGLSYTHINLTSSGASGIHQGDSATAADDAALNEHKVGVYSLSRFKNEAAKDLLKIALAQHTADLGNYVVVLLLDWSNPLRFIESLLHILSILAQMPVCQSTAAKEMLQRVWQSYTEPSAARQHMLSSVTADEVEPLPEGVLADNLGIPLLIVATKVRNVAECRMHGS